MSDANNAEVTGNVESVGALIDSESINPRKKPIPKSEVWKHFTKLEVQNDKKEECVCNYCHEKLSCASKYGTSHLKRHLKNSCRHFKRITQKQQLLNFNLSESGSTLTSWKFEQDKSREDLARLLVLNELSFRLIEQEAFRTFVRNLQPKFKFVSRFTIKRDCMKIYEREKLALKELLRKSSQRVSITTDMWTSNQTLGYMSLTVHFISDEWKLNKKIISFCVLPSRHTGENIADMLANRLMEWNIEKLCTITVDNASTNDVVVRHLIDNFSSRNGLLLNGRVFHIRCWAHILNLIVQDGLGHIKDIIFKIRTIVKHVKYSVRRLQEFNDIAKQEQISSTVGLNLDVQHRWNSTYLMIKAALCYQKVFNRIKARDDSFCDAPTTSEWKRAEILCDFLENFYRATNLFSGHQYPTSNLFFPIITDIHQELICMRNNEDLSMRNMAVKMLDKFEKYWKVRDNNTMLAIASVLDPRYKLSFLKFCYSKVYGEEEVEEYIACVDRILHDLYDEYSITYNSLLVLDNEDKRTSERITSSVSKRKSSVACEFRKKKRDINSFETRKSEIDIYLEDTSADDVDDDDESFDVLLWWKLNSSKYKILAIMARDILAIPVSTVASESAFSTGGRVLDQYRSRLDPTTVEALICLQDWLKGSSVEEDNVDESQENSTELNTTALDGDL